IVVENGCEYTPVHLHAMPIAAEFTGVECFLAGSFGDGIGRGEYSGATLKELKGLDHNSLNVAGLLRDDFNRIVKKDVMLDIQTYHKRFPEREKYQLFEQDMQIHYMRRMLNPCMSIINRKRPLFQMFTSPSVYGYIWSL